MADIYYTDEHEYIDVEGNIGTVGISTYAQEQLGDVVFVELPATGKEFEQGDESGVVESVKAASEIYAPVSGEVIEINEDLSGNPSLVNEDPQGDGWFYKIKIADTGELETLKTAQEYKEYVSGL